MKIGDNMGVMIDGKENHIGTFVEFDIGQYSSVIALVMGMTYTSTSDFYDLAIPVNFSDIQKMIEHEDFVKDFVTIFFFKTSYKMVLGGIQVHKMLNVHEDFIKVLTDTTNQV